MPNETEIERIWSILRMPDFKDLSSKDKSLIWKYRYYMKQNISEGISKLLLSVPWNKASAAKEALILIEDWGIPLESALLMISFKFCANIHYGLGVAK